MSLIQPLVQPPVPDTVDSAGLTSLVKPLPSAVFTDIAPPPTGAGTPGIIDSVFGDPVFQESQSYSFALVDSLGISEPGATGTQTDAQSPTEPVGITDSLVVIQTMAQSPTDALGVSDQMLGGLVVTQTITDSLGVTDLEAASTTRAITDSLGVTEATPAEQINVQSNSADAVGLTDAVSQSATFVQTITDVLGASDPLVQAATASQSQTDAVGLTETIGVSIVRTITDFLGVLDVEQTTVSYTQTTTDALGVAELESQGAADIQGPGDAVGLTDSLLTQLIPPGRFRYDAYVPVRPSRAYVWSIYANLTLGSAYGFLEVRFFDTNHALLSTASTAGVPLTADMVRLVNRVNTPANAAYVGLYAGMANASTGAKVEWKNSQWEQGEVETAYAPKPDEIQPGAVASTMLALGAVTTDRVSAGAITNSLVAVGAIDTNSLAANAVTNAKMAAGSVNTSQLVVGSVITGAIAAGAITTDRLAAGSVTAATIAAGSVGASQIAANSIYAAAIQANAVTAGAIAAGSVSTAQLVAGSVTTAVLAAGAVTASQIAANTITSSQIASQTITATQIATDTITAGQIAASAIGTSELAANSVLAGNIAAGNIYGSHIAGSTIEGSNIDGYTISGYNIAGTAITGDKIAANAITTGLIAAGNVVSDSISGGAITGKTLIGGTLATNFSGNDRVELVGASGLYDALRWYNYLNSITGEIRGFMGDIGAYGLHLNSTLELGNPNASIYQTGRRVANNGATQVRMGTATASADGSGNFTANFNAGMPNTPSVVVACLGQGSGSYPIAVFAVTGWSSSGFSGVLKYFKTDASGISTAIANPGTGATFSVRYYAECAIGSQ